MATVGASAGGRDRDAQGRPRQARPRDALGRPLAYGSEGVPPVPEQALPPRETVLQAERLLAQGRPFAAHEVLEARWKDAPDRERDLWQGLAQLCVGITHAERGNVVGARRLVDRGLARVAAYGQTRGPTYGADLAQWQATARQAVDRLPVDRQAPPS